MGKASELAWSFSRAKTLSECPRRLFFEHYAYSEKGCSNAWDLKTLRSIPAIAGDKVDTVVSFALHRLKRDGVMPVELGNHGVRLYGKNLRLSLDHVKQMRSGVWDRKAEEVKHHPPLQHHYYGYDLGKEQIETFRDRVRTCLTNFEQSELLAKLNEIGPANWVSMPTITDDVPAFTLDDLNVYAKFDFAVRDGRTVVVLDWKTGFPSDNAEMLAQRQLAVYGLYMHSKHGVPLADIRVQSVWLQRSVCWEPESLSPTVVDSVTEQIANEHSAELALLRPRVFKSGRVEYWAKNADFEPKPELNKCLQCKFRELCREGQIAVAALSYHSRPNTGIGAPAPSY